MPRRKLNVPGGADATPEFGRAPYDGPLGVPVRVRVKQLKLSKSQNDNDVLNFVCEVAEPAGSALARHNSQSAWGSYTMTKDWFGRINGMFVSMGLSDKDRNSFWGVGPNVGAKDSRDREPIESIGSVKIDDDGVPAVVTFKEQPAEGQYAARIKVGDFLVAGAPDEDEEGFVEEPDEAIAEEVAEEATEPEVEEDPAFEARVAELEAMQRAEIVKIYNKDYQLGGTKGVSEDTLINAILEHEFPTATEGEETEEEASVEEPEVEAAPEPEPEPEAATPAPSRRATARRPTAQRVAKDKPPF